MNNKSNSVPLVGTEVENSTKVDATSVNPNDTKPIVGCSATLSDDDVQKAKDFLWKHLAVHNKSLLIHIISTNEILERYSKELKEITIDRDLQIGYSFK